MHTDYPRARELSMRALAMFEAVGDMRREMGGGPTTELVGVQAPLGQVRAKQSESDFQAAVTAGEAMSDANAVALATSVLGG